MNPISRVTMWIAVRLYSVTLVVLPPRARRSVGGEMIHALDPANPAACRSALARRGVSGVARVALMAMLDTVRCAPREWRDVMRQVRRDRGARKRVSLRSVGGTFSREVRQAVKFVVRRKTYAAVVVVTLAFGVGANTTVFSVVYGVLLRESVLPNADRLVTVSEVNADIDIPPRWASAPNYLDWKAQSETLAHMAMFRGRSMSVTGGEQPLYVYGAFVTTDFFPAMGVAPLMGRGINDEESEQNSAVAVIGHGLWQSVTGGDPSILGRTINIDGVARTVIGVMPPGFASPGPWIGPGVRVDVWIPFTFVDDRRVNRSYHVVARLSPEVSLDEARSEMVLVQDRLASAYPTSNAEWRTELVPWLELVVGNARTTLLLAWLAAGFVLLMACVNVTGLAVNRTLARRGEMALRVALGAGRGRIVMQLLVENLVLSLLGGVLGFALAAAGVTVITSMNPGAIPLADRIELNLAALGLTFGAAVVAGMVVTVAAVQVSTVRLANLSAAGGRHTSAGSWIKSGLTITQLSITFALMFGAGLLTRSIVRLERVDLGISAENVYQASIALSWDRVTTLPERARFVASVLDGLRALPGVTSAGMINSLPFSGSNAWQPIWLAGQPIRPAEEQPVVSQRHVSPGYFDTMGIPLLRGRDFTETDLETQDVAIVNRAMAVAFWDVESAVGQQLAVNNAQDTLTIVGVIGDIRHFGPREDAPSELYQAYTRDFLTSKSFVIRTAASVDDVGLGDLVRNVIYAQDRDQPVRDSSPMKHLVRSATATERFSITIMGVASTIAITLATIGVFGVMTNLMLQRRRELAIRMALGSTNRRMLGLILWTGVRLGIWGTAIGILLSLYGNNLMANLLFDISPRDGTTYVLAGLTTLSVCLFAGLLPGLRALRVAPARVLGDQ